MNEIKIEIQAQLDVITARQKGREMAKDLGFGSADQTRFATAISELTRNVIQYAGKGVCIISDESNEKISRIQVMVEDRGPGIADIEQAMEYGYSTGGGLGAGLPGAQKLVDSFEIESEPGHTKVTIGMTDKKFECSSAKITNYG